MYSFFTFLCNGIRNPFGRTAGAASPEQAATIPQSPLSTTGSPLSDTSASTVGGPATQSRRNLKRSSPEVAAPPTRSQSRKAKKTSKNTRHPQTATPDSSNDTYPSSTVDVDVRDDDQHRGKRTRRVPDTDTPLPHPSTTAPPPTHPAQGISSPLQYYEDTNVVEIEDQLPTCNRCHLLMEALEYHKNHPQILEPSSLNPSVSIDTQTTPSPTLPPSSFTSISSPEHLPPTYPIPRAPTPSNETIEIRDVNHAQTYILSPRKAAETLAKLQWYREPASLANGNNNMVGITGPNERIDSHIPADSDIILAIRSFLAAYDLDMELVPMPNIFGTPPVVNTLPATPEEALGTSPGSQNSANELESPSPVDLHLASQSDGELEICADAPDSVNTLPHHVLAPEAGSADSISVPTDVAGSTTDKAVLENNAVPGEGSSHKELVWTRESVLSTASRSSPTLTVPKAALDFEIRIRGEDSNASSNIDSQGIDNVQTTSPVARLISITQPTPTVYLPRLPHLPQPLLGLTSNVPGTVTAITLPPIEPQAVVSMPIHVSESLAPAAQASLPVAPSPGVITDQLEVSQQASNGVEVEMTPEASAIPAPMEMTPNHVPSLHAAPGFESSIVKDSDMEHVTLVEATANMDVDYVGHVNNTPMVLDNAEHAAPQMDIPMASAGEAMMMDATAGDVVMHQATIASPVPIGDIVFHDVEVGATAAEEDEDMLSDLEEDEGDYGNGFVFEDDDYMGVLEIGSASALHETVEPTLAIGSVAPFISGTANTMGGGILQPWAIPSMSALAPTYPAAGSSSNPDELSFSALMISQPSATSSEPAKISSPSTTLGTASGATFTGTIADNVSEPSPGYSPTRPSLGFPGFLTTPIPAHPASARATVISIHAMAGSSSIDSSSRSVAF
ncbi:hypothetical protein FRB93_003030 [Tulasnella sp. JGI-2019a]|nr:hypothetical protein FRB93_003030 [Tulasnella sp. JGI-2019a]